MCAQKSVKESLRIPFPTIINIGIGIGVLLIGWMLLPLSLLPLYSIQLWEECSRFGEGVVDIGDIQLVGEGERLLIDLSASDDKHLLFACAAR